MMFEIYAVVAASLIAVGVIAGVLVIFAVGIHREERAASLGGPSPDRITGGIRAVTNAYVSQPQKLHPCKPGPELVLAGQAQPGRPSVRTW
jgi:hypothetical protein